MNASHILQPHAVADALMKPGNRVAPTNPFEPFKAADVEQSIPERFQQIAAKYPGNVAVKTSRGELRYDQLNWAANRLAHAILAQCGADEQRVAFVVQGGTVDIVASIGILKAGKTMTPLSASFPLSRNAEMLESAEASLIVTDNDNLVLAGELASARQPVLNLDALDPTLSAENLNLRIAPDALAAIMYTSGSTGQPKGVMRSHRSMLHGVKCYTNRSHYSASDRVMTLYGFAFMGGMGTAMLALLNGACFLPWNVQEQGIGDAATWIQQQGVTCLACNATSFRHLAGTMIGKEFATLRQVAVSGEVLYPADVERFKQNFGPQCILSNVLASSEMFAVCSYLMDKNTDVSTGIVPVGYEYDDVQVLLWDEAGHDVGAGQVGEIVVRSRFLSPGYWRQPELTQTVFLADLAGGDERLYRSGDLGMRLPDGALVHLGRRDAQVKIHGYRIELAEVETALMAVDNVKDVAVVARPASPAQGEQRLVAYLAPQHEPAPTVSAIRRDLADRLPGYMIPSAFVVLDRLPLGATGKVDRKVLPEPPATRPELATPFVAPRNATEARLASIWEHDLGIQPVGIQDSFFDLGGGSLSYFSVLMETEKEFGKPLPADAFRLTPTIEHLAQVLAQSYEEPAATPLSRAGRPFSRSRAGAVSWLRSPRKLLHGAGRMARGILFNTGPRWGRFVLPYASGTRFIAWLSGQRWAQATLFCRQVRLVQECMALVGTSDSDKSGVVRLSLACNFWRGWRSAAVSRCTPEEFQRWVTVEGLDTLRRAYEQGRGVVLVTSHFTQMGVTRSVIRRSGLPQAVWVQGLYERAFERAEAPLTSLYTRQLYEAQQVLRGGGIVGVAADGKEGSGAGLMMPFFGRQLALKTGFAELATTANAPVVLVRVAMDLEGHVKVVFMPPLAVSGEVHQQQVASLVLQYAEVLRQEWATNLAGIAWHKLASTLQALPAGDAPARPEAP